MKPVRAPSGSSDHMSEDLYSFLSNSAVRKKYNNTLNLAKKFRNTEAKIEYLKIGMDEMLISTDSILNLSLTHWHCLRESNDGNFVCENSNQKSKC